jgi:lipid A disaccharide synthetase
MGGELGIFLKTAQNNVQKNNNIKFVFTHANQQYSSIEVQLDL